VPNIDLRNCLKQNLTKHPLTKSKHRFKPKQLKTLSKHGLKMQQVSARYAQNTENRTHISLV